MAKGRERAAPSPTRVVLRTFAVLILTGTLLLRLPAATASGTRMPLLDAAFTATSATCVTGLILVDTETYFSPFGKGVILVLIQLGGLGIMTLAAFVAVAIGRRLGIGEKTRLRDVLDTGALSQVRPTILFIVGFTALFEITGTGLLYLRWRGDPSVPDPLFTSVFHSVSAFCNAGFSTFGDSLMRFRGDAAVNVILAALIVVGGLGSSVLWNLMRAAPALVRRRRKPQLTLHTKFVLTATGVLLAIGIAGFLALEWNGVLAGASAREKLCASVFQGVTPRTAGFNSVEIGDLRPATLFLFMGLMLCGGAPGSTAGGVKVTTLMILGAAALALLQGRKEQEVVAFRRTIPVDNVRRALAIFFLYLLTAVLFALLLLVTENQSFEGILFETFSAIGTVGLSTGVTPGLTAAGKLLVVILMIVGRIGPISVAFAVTGQIRKPAATIQFPEERVMVG